jgi:GNAT superfamily N-acetyltransferase
LADLEYRRGEYSINTEQAKLDLPFIHGFLSELSYWARGRTYTKVEQSIRHSLCFGVYVGQRQIGFARVVTDYTSFAWLCDVFIVDSHRQQGLSKWLVQCVTSHPELRDVSRFVLATRDAHELYRRYGKFDTLANPEWWMART